MKLFNRITLPPARGNIVTPKYLQRCFQAVLGKFNMTVEGAEVQQTGDGHLHMRVTSGSGSGDCAFPFKVAISADGYMTVDSGEVRMENSSPVVPILAGTGLRLNAANQPRRFIPAFTGTGYVLLKIKHQAVLGAFALGNYTVLHVSGGSLMEDPSIAVVSARPSNIVGTIDWGTGAVTPGERYVLLATLTGNGTSITIEQGWWGHMHVIVTGTGDTQLNIGG